ncbi:MAG: XamI family restriction endonuclease [Caldilineaceae bacterium]
MAVNRDKPDGWKSDIAQSVDMYNNWFLQFAPDAFRTTRIQTTQAVENTLKITENLTNLQPEVLRLYPEILPTLRMATCPPLAVDRLIGLAGVSSGLVKRIELEKKLPPRMMDTQVEVALGKIGAVIAKMADPDILVWLQRTEPATEGEIHRAATIIADRLCGSVANPIIRNAQEKRQLKAIRTWLEEHGYHPFTTDNRTTLSMMPPGTFCFRMNVPTTLGDGIRQANMPIDVVIMPKDATTEDFPLLIEAKSAGDFTNVNKRRKEEAMKMTLLRATYGDKIRFSLFLCGYFDTGYLGYEAAEGIDWVWEHRINDLAQFGL